MKVLIIIVAILGSCSNSHAQLRINKDSLVALLQQGKTLEVFLEASRLRNEKYGKCALVDYFIAKSLCMDQHFDKSGEWFAYIEKNYPLDPSSSRFIRRESSSCQRTPDATSATTLSQILSIPIPKSSVGGSVGKMGFVADCWENRSRARFDSLVNSEEMAARVFPLNNPNAAIAKIKSLLPDSFDVRAGERFLMVTEKGQPPAKFKAVAASLERAYQFFSQEYGLRAPDNFITVYLAPYDRKLQQMAKRIHNIDISYSTIGYSMLGDLSLMGIASMEPNTLGTLYHELWHLVIRGDVGDIPAWLDEGMACLYSTSHWDNKGRLVGNGYTWRQGDLRARRVKDLKAKIPSLERLLQYSWTDFNGGENGNECQAAVNYALANHLLIFLQEKKLLKEAVKVVKFRRTPGDSSQQKAMTDTTLLAGTTGGSFAKFDAAFQKWFDSAYHFSLRDTTRTIAEAPMDFDTESAYLLHRLDSLKNNNRISVEEHDRYTLQLKDLQKRKEAAANHPDEPLNNAPANVSQQTQQTMATQSQQEMITIMNELRALSKKIRSLPAMAN